MGTKIRMADIAKALGVSTVTVSRALSGKDGVGDAMRESILRAAEDMGYQPKLPAKALLNGETVGILLSCRFIGKGHSFYWDLYERVFECLGENDAFGILEPVKLEDESAQLDQRYRQMLVSTGLPVVQMDAYSAGFQLDTVISDGYYGMYTMTDYLLRQGHRRIAYVGSVGTTSSITDRYFGYCRALQEWGITVRQDWVLPDRKEHEKVLIPLPEDMPTAFVCNCDSVAQKLIERLNENGLHVPEDVSVVGFDGFSLTPISPALVTYAVDMEGMARASVKQLMDRLADPSRPPKLRIVPGHFVKGDSVKSIL